MERDLTTGWQGPSPRAKACEYPYCGVWGTDLNPAAVEAAARKQPVSEFRVKARVAVHEGPDVGFPHVGDLEEGTVVTVLEQHEHDCHWFRVAYGGRDDRWAHWCVNYKQLMQHNFESNPTKLTDDNIDQFVVCERCKSVPYCSGTCRSLDRLHHAPRGGGFPGTTHADLCTEDYMDNAKLPYVEPTPICKPCPR
jgi:radical SAM protein with 4Fe4S-binding SPASM domain